MAHPLFTDLPDSTIPSTAVGVRALEEAGEQLLRHPAADHRARRFIVLVGEHRQEQPEALLQLAEALLEIGHRDEIALCAAALAWEAGDRSRAKSLLERIPEVHPGRQCLHQRWAYETVWQQAEPLLSDYIRQASPGAVPPELLAALAGVVEASISAAREEARFAFYGSAQETLLSALKIGAPLSTAANRPATRDFSWLLQRIGLKKKREEKSPEQVALRRAIKRARAFTAQLENSTGWLGRPLKIGLLGARIAATPRRLLYLTFGSLPHDTNGNTSRTHGLLGAMAAAGWGVRCVTRPGFPQQLQDELHARTSPLSQEESWENSYHFDRVLYTNLRPPEARRRHYDLAWKADFMVDAAMTLARRDRPALIHGASNHLIGAAAVQAAERLGLPGVYELRGMLSLDYASQHPDFIHTPEYARMEARELEIARRASHVFAISRGIRRFLLDRGIEPQKVTLLPNGVDPDYFRPGPARPELLRTLGVEGRTVIGFVGTLSHHEGIGFLIDALRLLRDRLPADSFAALLIGSGPMREAALEQIRANGLSHLVASLPSVPFSEVHDYLRAIDIVAIPRPGNSLCELVTPIKPFEAMALEKTVVASSVGGLTEIIGHGSTGLIHEKESAEALADTLEQAVRDPALRVRLGRAARDFVERHHDWRHIAREAVSPVYERLTGHEWPAPSPLPSFS